MKKTLLACLFLLFVSGEIFAQVPCAFTTTQSGTTSTYTFVSYVRYPSPANFTIWNFGDGNFGYNDSIQTHTYNSVGAYVVCQTVIDSVTGTTVCQYCDSLYVGTIGGPCSFTATTSPASLVVVFAATPSVPGSTINWDFGNGITGTGTVYTYSYPLPGTYTVCMTEVDALLGTTICTTCTSVTVSGTSTSCSFAHVQDTSNANLIHFSATPSSAGNTITWDFGDSQTGTGASISHLYSTSGMYGVFMTETDSNGIVVCTAYDTIVAGINTTCNFSFIIDSLNFNLVYFAANTGVFGMVTWDFGDGTTGSGVFSTHQYTIAGTYYVCMYVHDPLTGAITCTMCYNVTVGTSSPCRSQFVSAHLGLTAYFIDLSNANPASTTYLWTFGDGDTSNSRFPSHTYTSPGTYYVCLYVAANGLVCVSCDSITVDTVISPIFTCQSFFVKVQLAPYQVTVVNLSSGINLTFDWDFGDGSPHSSLPYPSHFYASTGAYNLCLTVSDTSGCTSTYCDSIRVDSLGNVYRGMSGFTLNVMSPSQLSTGIQDIPANVQLKIYPNPVRSDFTVVLPQDLKGNILYKVYSINGAEMTKGLFIQGENKLNVGWLSSGIYILEVSDSQGFRSYSKLIKE